SNQQSKPTPLFKPDTALAWNAWNHLSITEVPEPSTMVLLLTGGLGLVGYRLRRRAQKLAT
ncbi:MAG: PEP-CTERM sorting domain-containing protein, partial [Planctomycetaceae bacterium]